jgi:hypothetical protein
MISWMTFGLLTASFSMTWVWFLAIKGSAQFEPAVTALGIAGTVIGIFAERAAGRREIADLTVWSIREELRINTQILDDQRFDINSGGESHPRVFPRLRLAAVEAAMSSGGLQALNDLRLLAELQAWLDTAHEFNRRLELTELRTLVAVGIEPKELKALDVALHRRNGHRDVLQRRIAELRLHPLLAEQTSKGSAR